MPEVFDEPAVPPAVLVHALHCPATNISELFILSQVPKVSVTTTRFCRDCKRIGEVTEHTWHDWMTDRLAAVGQTYIGEAA